MSYGSRDAAFTLLIGENYGGNFNPHREWVMAARIVEAFGLPLEVQVGPQEREILEWEEETFHAALLFADSVERMVDEVNRRMRDIRDGNFDDGDPA